LDSARLLRPLQQYHVEAGDGVFPSELLSQAKERLQQFPERIALSEERAQKEARRVCENAIIHGSLFQAVTEAAEIAGRYLYRGVIREQDILHCRDGMVTFRYRHVKSGKDRTRIVKGEYFLYLVTLHILPKGFRRARSYGFLHSCSKKLISFLQLVLPIAPWRRLVRSLKQRPAIICPVCGAAFVRHFLCGT
jgi:hypothetical protein